MLSTATSYRQCKWRSRLGLVVAVLLPCLVPTICLAQESIEADKTAEQKATPPIDDSINEIVVTGRHRSKIPIRNVVDYFKKYCFEANRLTGHSETPDDDPDWHALSEVDQLRLGATTPGAKAFGFSDPNAKLSLFLKTEQPLRSDGLHEERCSLIVVGGPEHFPFVDKISAVLHGSPTRRHVGARDGVPKIPGWKQWLWSGMSARHSKTWRVSPTARGSKKRDTWLVVVDKRFYNDHDYLLGELKTTQDGPIRISILSFSHISKDAQ